MVVMNITEQVRALYASEVPSFDFPEIEVRGDSVTDIRKCTESEKNNLYDFLQISPEDTPENRFLNFYTDLAFLATVAEHDTTKDIAYFVRVPTGFLAEKVEKLKTPQYGLAKVLYRDSLDKITE